ncbi:MAG: sigma 54-interacting transcriptional regulator [Candidatus Zixiibacteriota bacterium]|nr:MAG: sigma 54-interacting transcriptional regulator [candidate division Zixibacteria bacterium]
MSEEANDKHLHGAFEELRSINRLIDKICRVRETNHIMSIIIDEAVKLSGANQGIINLVTRVKEVGLVTVVRKQQPSSEDLPFKVNDQICGWVLRNQMLLKIDDLDNDERVPGLSSEKGRFKSVLCCPMVSRGDVVGLLSLVRDKDTGPFTDEHGRVVGIVASQSAQLLSNALLLEELARKNELLQLSRQELHDENIRLKAEIKSSFAFENIIGKSEHMKKVLTLASKVSANDSPVLINGETGTGKELVARAIHFNSHRKDKPFVIKNCGVKTETLLESELFGHRKGAFTGADKDKPGLFKEADGGTVFLDEIGDAPLSTQVAILRVIETGEIRPVGASKTDFVDVRVISATNKNLQELIDEKKFRQDLFYRLNTFTITMPPLRHRVEDISPLTEHVLKKLRVRLRNDELSISPEALKALEQCRWPGNVRQLENEIERAALVCDTDNVITMADLSPEVTGVADSEVRGTGGQGALREAVENIERDLITKTLAEMRGNILKSSKLLGLTRKGLKDKMSRYGIKWED